MDDDDLKRRLYRKVGAVLRKERDRHDLTQEQLAAMAGLKRTTITNIEAGRNGVPLFTLFKLADALDLEPHDLIPHRDDLRERSRVPVVVGGRRTEVPEETAAMISRLLDTGTEA